MNKDGTTSVGIATNVVFIQSNPKIHFQNDPELAPHNWVGKLENTADFIYEYVIKLNLSVFRYYRHRCQ